jgi:effector-binding domain-containing protein
VHAILEEHAGAIRREIESQRETLTRVERALALVAREGVAASAASAGAVVVKQVPEVRAVGRRCAIRVPEIVALAREVERTLAGPPIGPRINVYYNEEFDPEQVDVEVLFPVAEGGQRALPAATVAAVLLVGLDDSAAVGAAYAAVYDWIEAQGRRDVGPPREVLLVGPEHGKRLSEQVMEIQVPIEPASEEVSE